MTSLSLLVYHPHRRQPWTVWHGGEVVGFTVSEKDAHTWYWASVHTRRGKPAVRPERLDCREAKPPVGCRRRK